MISYANIIAESIVDGQGLRVVAFLQGCIRHCEGCHNPELLPATGGTEMDERAFAGLLLDKITPLHRGITFSGGDPLIQPDALLKTVKFIKDNNPRIDIWVYTGFTFAEVKDLPVMNFIDVLVDGPFIIAQRSLSLPFRGSANQRLIAVKQSLASDKIIEINL